MTAHNWSRGMSFSRPKTLWPRQPEQDEAPASNSPEDLRAYVQKSLDESAALTSSIDAEVGYSPLIYEVSISDVNGTVLISSDASLPGKQTSQARTDLAQLVSSSFVSQLRATLRAAAGLRS